MSLPNAGMSFTAFDVLTAAEMNDLVENIESLADGSGFDAGAIGTADIADGAVTPEKLAAGLPAVIEFGNTNIGTVLANASQNNTITFTKTFSTAPQFIAMPGRSADNGTFAVKLISISSTQAVVRTSNLGAGDWSNVMIHWIAMELTT